MNQQETLDKQNEFLFPCIANYYEKPVVITEAKGTQVKDVDGVEYLDFFGGILTVSLGHCHPEVVDVGRRHAQPDVARRTAAIAIPILLMAG